jgi:steroid delta-isomerase-like uncharacterized protein
MSRATEVAQDYLACFNDRDFERVRTLLDPDFTYRGADGVEQKGADFAVDLMRMYATAFPDGRIEIESIVEMDGTVLVEFRGSGTHDGELMGIAPTGKKMEIVVCDVLRVEDGMIVSEHEYIDMLAMLQQLGVAPELVP